MKRFYTILFIAFIFSFSLTAKVNSAKPEVRVLFISSYSSAYPTFSQQYEGVKSVIGHERNSVLDVEFMDCKDIVNDPVNIDLFRKLLAYRMSKLDRYQVILVADDDAFQFAIREQDKLFKGIPIVFLGVDNVQAALRQNQNPQMTGVVEKVSLKETVDLMIKLFLRCQQIYAITDSTISGQEQNSNLENLISNVDLKKSFKIINLSTMTYADFAKSLQAIPQSDPVLYLSAFIDKSGKSITFDNSMKLIRHNLSSPIFTLWDHGFGDGLFGGKVVSHYEQGRAAAQIAKSILEGKTPADIPVISSSPNKFIFDYREVKKHNICLSRLPRGSSVLFKPYSFFEQNKTIVLLGSSVFILMAVLLYVLIAKRIKMKHIMDVMLQEKNKAQIADKLKSAFLANMSHEIRTPLNAIVGFSELLQNTDDPGEKAKFVEIINQNNDTLLRLVGDILDLSKIESGLLELHPEHFDMVELYDSLYQMNKSRWNKPEVNFEGVDPYVNCFVYLDKSRIRQIWTNFLTNAIKYTAKGKISMGYEYVLEGLKIYVTDTGIGIPDDKRDRVFQRFEKFDTFAKGTGLGLSICKAIVDQCKGKIGFESVYGEGSTFWAWIPCEAEINLAQMPPEPIKITKDMPIVEISSCKSPCSILAAEDNDGNYMLLKVFLKDYKLTRAVNGAEAVGLASHNKYDVILMDMKMPIMDGLEATAKIREFDKKTPIVALTANAFDSDKAAAMNAGCTDFLSKPFEKSELIAVLNKACHHNLIFPHPKMKRIWLILVLLYSAAFLLQAGSSEESKNRILFIGSYSISYAASDMQISGLRSELEKLPDYCLDLKYMDCKRLPGDSTNVALFKEMIAHKLQNSAPYSVIIAGDDDAFNFVLSEQYGLFKGIPIVFFGVNNVAKARAQNSNPQVTGVMEQVSYKDNVDLMIKLFPDSDDICVICDNVKTGVIMLNAFKKFWSQAHYPKHLQIIDASTMTFSQLSNRLREIPSNTPSLLFSLYCDKTGHYISFDDGIQFVSLNSKSPIFHFWSLGIGSGLFGGNVVSLYDLGKEAGKLALEIIGGKSPAELKVRENSANKYYFDYKQLSRFHVSLNDIPQDSVIINKPHSFYSNNKVLVWLASIVFLIMEIIIYVLIISRIRMRRSLQELALEKNKALEADKRKSAFLASMSHEIRTPLNAIVGFSELLQNTDDNATRDNFIKIINQNNDSLLSLVNDILDLSKIESGILQFKNDTFDMTECCQALYGAMIDFAASKPALKMNASIPYQSCIVTMDRSRLEQVWKKYVDNSIKYTNSGTITMGYEYVDGGIKIFSKDTGIGIPQDKQDRIFQRFEKVDMFSKGTGLGLAICKAIIIRFGGNVGFESEQDKGSTFWAWIPCKAEITQ